MDNIQAIIDENRRRNSLLSAPYEPLKGTGSAVKRVRWPERPELLLPEPMLEDVQLRPGMSDSDFERLRLRHDFEYWAARCVKIRHKLTGRMVPFVLNPPQRRVAALLERERMAGRPLRIIMLKARQWGGSTLVQMYMAWIQCCHATNWHSLICGHVLDVAATIRGMYTYMLDSYPEELWMNDTASPAREDRKFLPFERSTNIRQIGGRGCRVTLASSEKPENARGQDISMAHLSEVAYWKDTPGCSAAAAARAILSGIPIAPLTLVAMESTANGVGNFFHDEWLRAESGLSDKAAVFVPWYEIEMYSAPVGDAAALWEQLDDYERKLWDASEAVTLEKLAWYHAKRREMPSHDAMQAEYPSNPTEAFTTTGHAVIPAEYIEQQRQGCYKAPFRGEIAGLSETGPGSLQELRLRTESNGHLEVWHDRCAPADTFLNRYIAVVDIGGRSEKADWSVIAVLERDRLGPVRTVAQWRGHIDHDVLAWRAAAIARYYHNALLVIESNTLETEHDGDSDFILNQIERHYGNFYYRITTPDDPRARARRIGFHTNRSTKRAVVSGLLMALREGTFSERSMEACNEFAVYESQPNGAYAARPGHHDDILMTRAIGLYVASTLPMIARVDEGVFNIPSY